ncbi:MAG: YceI family protein [Methylobacteriaceae bacterium]|nr:YceI family protein [Methylobacteriaceae bacterium]
MHDRVPAGRYVADTDHSSVVFRIKHLGLAGYLGRFTRFSAALDFDPDEPERMRVEAEIEVASVDTAYSGKHGDWNAKLGTDPDWLDGARNPIARFASSTVVRTGDASADVAGDFTFRGATHPVTLAATYNGGLLKDQFDRTLVGFSARGTLRRSLWGLTSYLGPLPEEVELLIEGEFAKA